MSSTTTYEYSSQLYELKLDSIDTPLLKFKRIVESGPSARASHGCVIYQNKFMFIFGGQGSNSPTSKSNPF